MTRRAFVFLSILLSLSGPLAAALHVDTPRPVAVPQSTPEYSMNARSIAVSGERALALWYHQDLEPAKTGLRGALFDSRGARVSAADISFPLISGRAAATGDGFLVYGASTYDAYDLIAYAVTRDGAVAGPLAIASGDAWDAVVRCAGDVCLAAWRTLPGGPAAIIRAARIEGMAVRDPGGIPVANAGAATDWRAILDVATDGSRFLIAWLRDIPPGGTIASAALVDPRGAMDIRTFDVLAVNEVGYGLRLLWNGAAFEVIESAPRYRVARVRPDGSVIDGEESGWGGWPVDIDGVLSDVFVACGRSQVATFEFTQAPAPTTSAIYEIETRSAKAIGTIPLRIAGVACFDGRRCLAIADDLTYRPLSRRHRAYVVPMTCARERVVGR